MSSLQRPAFGLALVLLLCMVVASGCRTPKGGNVAEKRRYARQMRAETLADLYQQNPEARAYIQHAPGYAVFSNVGSKILMLATGSGFGILHDNEHGIDTYMRMVEAGGGVGIGIKTYKAVYVFNDRDTLTSFREGRWQVGSDADVGAGYEGRGMSAGVALDSDQFSKPVTVYQFTDNGISLSAVATGARFFPDEELD